MSVETRSLHSKRRGTDRLAQVCTDRSVLPQQCRQQLLTGSSWEDVSLQPLKENTSFCFYFLGRFEHRLFVLIMHTLLRDVRQTEK